MLTKSAVGDSGEALGVWVGNSAIAYPLDDSMKDILLSDIVYSGLVKYSKLLWYDEPLEILKKCGISLKEAMTRSYCLDITVRCFTKEQLREIASFYDGYSIESGYLVQLMNSPSDMLCIKMEESVKEWNGDIGMPLEIGDKDLQCYFSYLTNSLRNSKVKDCYNINTGRVFKKFYGASSFWQMK